MEVRTAQRDKGIVLSLHGDLVRDAVGAFKSALCEQVPQGSHVIAIDMTEVTYMDSAGLGALISAHKNHPAIVLEELSPWVQKFLATTGLLSVFHVRDNMGLREGAEDAARARPGRETRRDIARPQVENER